MDFTSMHNYHENLVINRIKQLAITNDSILTDSLSEEELVDAACIALNELPSRYVRHDIDTIFYLTHDERSRLDLAVIDAVSYAFNFIKSRKNRYPHDGEYTQKVS